MTGWQKTTLIGVGIICASVVTILLVGRIFPPMDDRVSACYALIPADRRAGIKINLKPDGTTDVELGGALNGIGPSSAQANAFADCLDRFLGQVRITTAIQSMAPLGEVANHWSQPGQFGLKLRLLPEGDVVLNNVAFGPAAGKKSEIVASWCKTSAACVTCAPRDPTEESPEVLIRLKPESRTTKTQLDGVWPVAADAKPWQIVDQDGRRYAYFCEDRPAQ